ncbi:hypothetical protein M3202_19770 [Alkalihalobacillus oceani]|uniref:Uncharacterized protein n=1 Tax=Halalkalibacter oceani TaxID=1653776 RepID=A0A9X2IQX2_9BACI|nr:hypothetical protein [Halalkalibacter oceani]MCM3716286.1 hypothetical protein [Halalkalibacter oceani]
MKEFSIERMKKLEEHDAYVRWLVKDLKRRNPSTSLEEIMKIVFNTIMEDRHMLAAYNSLETGK